MALAATLSACGQGESDAPEADAVVGGHPTAVATTASGAPRRAAGFWELKNIGGGGTVLGTQRLCVSDASEERASLFDQIARNTNCSKYEIKPDRDTWSFEFVCGGEGLTSISKGMVSGDFLTAYQLEMTDSDGTMELSRTIEASRKGDCPAGVAPGTLLDEQGGVIADITR